ncbi:MAG TPA: glycosyltransferase family 2 protein [Gammaproteobacteria bacterium]
MTIARITPVIIARNAAGTLARTLRSLETFREVIVYENGSTDATEQVAASFPNTRVITGDFIGFGPTKNRAASFAATDWILSIDGDEYLAPALVDELAALPLDDAGVAYAVKRHNLLLGKLVEHGGWGDDWLVRLYNRNRCRVNNAMVHEKVEVPRDCRVVRLDGALWHEAVTDVDQFLRKISRYSELRRGDGAKTHRPLVILCRACWAFFRSLVLEAGFLAGWRGVLIAYANATGTFFRHMKRYADRAVAAEQAERAFGSALSDSPRPNLRKRLP